MRTLEQDLYSIVPAIVASAQAAYNKHDLLPEDIEDLAGGGICDDIAEAIAEAINEALFSGDSDVDVEAKTVHHMDENHTLVYVRRIQQNGGVEVVMVDIPYHIYETQRGYYQYDITPNVVFEPNNVLINTIDISSEDFDALDE